MYLSSLAVLTRAYTSSHILTRTYTPLGVLTDIPLTSESVAKLYNFVAMSERGKDNGVSIRRKKFISYKENSYKFIWKGEHW